MLVLLLEFSVQKKSGEIRVIGGKKNDETRDARTNSKLKLL
jgi:hypothetical protein